MVPLHRHQLARLTDEGWRRLLDQDRDSDVSACLAHWSQQRLPLVVTRQSSVAQAAASDQVALGLAAPQRWQRRRIALAVPQRDIAWFDEFARADDLAPSLSARSRDWRSLCLSLKSVGATARVYGSRGWQLLTGMAYVHARSDIDLWVAVTDAGHADAVVALLAAFDTASGAEAAPRLDGELLFPRGHGVAWREWRDWRAGACRTILAKTLTTPLLVSSAPAGVERQMLVASPW